MTAPEELDALLNDAISLAIRLIEKSGSHIPFCLAITNTGERVNIAGDDSELPGTDTLLATLRHHLAATVGEGGYRAVALASNVEYRSAINNAQTDAIRISLDHQHGSPVTCYLPYQTASQRVVRGELFAVAAEEQFFAHGG